ncbi:MAG TPA: ABC transporter permease [Candidatus Sulfotelmatobacter sp.]|nr:ABC transporter permease [Candidatus Sulfotelmatobacter sp.]
MTEGGAALPGRLAGRDWSGVRRLRRRLGGGAAWGIGAGLFLALEALLALGASLLTSCDPLKGDLELRLLAPGAAGHLLGTDQLGRDLLARMLYGARISLVVGGVAVAVAGTVGVAAGLVMAYRGGWLDSLGSRLVDVQLSFPFMALALSIAAVLGASLTAIVATLAISSWVLYARLVRGETLAMKQHEFVEAARTLGAPGWRILLRHVLPNVLGPAVALASLEAGRLIVAEASLSFLGYGIQPPIPAWGNMLAEGKDYMARAWWLTVLPGVAVSLTCLSTTLLGDWLTEVLDPRQRR